MMRNYLILLFLLSVQFGIAQVGIGTTTPTAGYNLDVAGDLLVQKTFNVKALTNHKTQDGTFKFLFRLLNSSPMGEVTKLNMADIKVGPINIANYKFTNLSGDNLTSVNLKFDAAKYIVGIADIRYIGTPVNKALVGSAYSDIGFFVARSFVESGSWHLEMRNRLRDITTGSVSYEVTVIVYDRMYFRELTSINVDFGGNQTGSASSPSGL